MSRGELGNAGVRVPSPGAFPHQVGLQAERRHVPTPHCHLLRHPAELNSRLLKLWVVRLGFGLHAPTLSQRLSLSPARVTPEPAESRETPYGKCQGGPGAGSGLTNPRQRSRAREPWFFQAQGQAFATARMYLEAGEARAVCARSCWSSKRKNPPHTHQWVLKARGVAPRSISPLDTDNHRL